jgi:polyferredoxin
MRSIKSKNQPLRTAIQITVFLLIAALAVIKYLKEQGIAIPIPEVSLHAVCPFGGVVTIYEYIKSGQFLPKLHSAAFVLMGIGMVVALLFGPIFCGYACPMGSFQEWIGKLGKKLLGKRYGKLISGKADKALRYLRYAMLALVLYQTALAGKLVFANVDPYYALFNFYSGEVALTALLALTAVTLLSFFVERPFCKYFCPYGALLGLTNLIRIFPVRRSAPTCINCKKCDKACPMQIKVSTGGAVRNHQCISCHKCLSGDACPVEDTVTISTNSVRRRVRVKPQIAVLISALIVIAGVFTSYATGYWATESDKIPQKLDVAAGEYDPADIRGSYTFGEISSLYGVSLADLADAFLLDKASAAEFQVKALKDTFSGSAVEIGTSAVRMFVAYYKGLPYTPTEENYLPAPAAAILLARGTMTAEQEAYLRAHTFIAP